MFSAQTSPYIYGAISHVPISEPITVIRDAQFGSENQDVSLSPPQETPTETRGLLGGEVDTEQAVRIVRVKGIF